MRCSTFTWRFPLTRPHLGLLQGNGLLAAMTWGEGNVLRITLGRADCWDHRGGLPWTEQMTWARIRQLLESRDAAQLDALFQGVPPAPGQPGRPTLLPLGRMELVFAQGLRLEAGTLDPDSGEIDLVLRNGSGGTHHVRTLMSMHEPVLHVLLPAAEILAEVRPVSAWQHLGEELSDIGFPPPQPIAEGPLTGWVQPCPSDPPIAVGCLRAGKELWMGVTRDGPQLSQFLSAARDAGAAEMQRRSAAWWADYWRDVPVLDIPNPNIAFLYRYGMYKFAGLTAPQGYPAGLQGAWIEDHRLPPWSGDYHFNINVQMCYGPAYQGNRLAHLRPILDMVWSWREKLRHHARLFVGIDDGLMLPHAVDDRCTNMGGFWSGTVDHGCTAWVAKMMYDYWLYGGDDQYLRDVAWPFMCGAMRVYEAMLDQRDGKLLLPVSVSPEYRGNRMDAWGANASFQLACIHWLLEHLQDAARHLDLPPRPQWADIARRLPRACLLGEGEQAQIALWEGTPLEESHRHHSHLAGISPFDVLDVDDPRWRQVIRNSFRTWIAQGMGLWSGWCVPWAAVLHTRLGNSAMAELLLEIWQRVYTNSGHGTLHDCEFAGFTLIGAGPDTTTPKEREIMQMDAGMGVTAAILDFMVHVRRGVHHFFAGAPAGWESVGFQGVRTAGGFLVSARRHEGQVTDLRVRATRAGLFRYHSPWDGAVNQVQMTEGQELQLRPTP